jgi:hypothetical protein
LLRIDLKVADTMQGNFGTGIIDSSNPVRIPLFNCHQASGQIHFLNKLKLSRVHLD